MADITDLASIDPADLLGLSPDDLQKQAAQARAMRTQPASMPSQGPDKPDLTGVPQPGPAMAPATGAAPVGGATDYRQKAIDLMTQAAQAQKPFDPAPFQEMAQQRADAANRNFLGGIALSALGGDQFQGIGGQVLQQALKQQEPTDVAGGLGTIAGGKFTPNQAKLAELQNAQLEKQAQVFEAMAEHAEDTDTKRAAQLAAEQTRRDQMRLEAWRAQGEMGMRQMMLQIQQMTAEGQRYQPMKNALGEDVLYDRQSHSFIKPEMPGGYERPDQLPPNAPETDKNAYNTSTDAIRSIDQLIANARSNPNAFGITKGWAQAADKIPFIGSGIAHEMGLSDEQMTLRNDLIETSVAKIKDLQRAARDPVVREALEQINIQPGDTLPQVVVKLNSARDLAAQQRSNIRTRYPQLGADTLLSPQQPAAAAAPGVTPAAAPATPTAAAPKPAPATLTTTGGQPYAFAPEKQPGKRHYDLTGR